MEWEELKTQASDKIIPTPAKQHTDSQTIIQHVKKKKSTLYIM